jgi:hypothetical protein
MRLLVEEGNGRVGVGMLGSVFLENENDV